MNTKKEDLKFVIVGHVDHGKSTLIGRLLFDLGSVSNEKINEIKEVCEALGKKFEFGYILDNLEEERDQGITIDTTQIFFDTDKRHYTIIDAPGHVEFVKNMITGASQAEAAVLIVDVEEGVQEQTRRHAHILSMLGINQIIIVLNKMDKISYKKDRFENVKKNSINFLKKLSMKPSFVIPISANDGENVVNKSGLMEWYKGPTLLEALNIFTPLPTLKERPLRFAVQDVYKHEKRIVVGLVESGILQRGDEVVVLPSGEKTKIAHIKEFLKTDIKEASAGKATGFITENKVFIDRGDIITDKKDQPITTNKIKVHLFWMDNEPLKKGERLIFECATQSVMCEVKSFEKIIDSSTLKVIERENELCNREVADLTLQTSKPVVIEPFYKNPALGKFILERKFTVGGGIITEVNR